MELHNFCVRFFVASPATFPKRQKIYSQQILQGLQAWLQGKGTMEFNLDATSVVKGRVITDWDGWFRFSANLPISEEATAIELRESKQRLENGLGLVIARWQNEPGKSFDDWCEEEVGANGDALLGGWLEYGQLADAVVRGSQPTDSLPPLNYAVRLVSQILHRLEIAGVKETERLAKAREYFASPIFRQIPVVNIGAAMWAGLAHRFRGGQKNWKPSIANDIIGISTYLPFCDAMFMEKECANLLTTNPVMKHVVYKTKVFSLRTKDNFLSYLKEIETSAPNDHVERVHAVYGKFWALPFSKLAPK